VVVTALLAAVRIASTGSFDWFELWGFVVIVLLASLAVRPTPWPRWILMTWFSVAAFLSLLDLSGATPVGSLGASPVEVALVVAKSGVYIWAVVALTRVERIVNREQRLWGTDPHPLLKVTTALVLFVGLIMILWARACRGI
jgi:hypothetical protein